MLGARSSWVRAFKHFRYSQHRNFCNPISLPNKPHHHGNNNNGRVTDTRDLEAYRDLDKLDFMKAAKILFSTPPKTKKFGLDFHLVQLFFALMPSLAVYLVAQYARYEMRKMEAELELKKKAEEEEKAKQMEAAAEEEKEKEKEKESGPELSEVKERLEALEKTVKEIVVETKRQPSNEKSKVSVQDQDSKGHKSRSDDAYDAAGNKPSAKEATSFSGQQWKQQDSKKRESQQDDKP